MSITLLKNRSLLGCFLVVLGTLIFAVVNGLVKEIGTTIPISMVVFVQGIVCIIYCLPWIYQTGLDSLKTQHVTLHVLRGLAELVAIYPLYWSFKYIPLVDGLLLNNAAPIWVPLLLFLLKRTKIAPKLWIGIFIGFLGVFVILRPGSEIFNWASCLAAVSGIATAYIMLALGDLGKTEPPKRIIFYCFATCCVVLFPAVLKQWVTPTVKDSLFMLLSSIGLLFAMLAMTHGFRLGKVAVLSPLFYLTVVFGGLVDWVFWQHVPSLLTVAGCILVAIGGIVTIVLESRIEPQHPV